MIFSDSELANNFLNDKLNDQRAFFISRLGYSELDYVSKLNKGPKLFTRLNQLKSFIKSPYSQYLRRNFLNSIGPAIEETYKNCDFHFYETADHIVSAEYYLNNKIGANRILLPQDIILPVMFKNPWINSLRGKRVLVVSPFVDDFQLQLNHYENIWPSNKAMAPAYTFLKYKMPFYFDNWKPALIAAKENISKINFDIALIGAGPISNLLGLYIRDSLKKKALNIGGALQLYYGILGQRWIDSGLVDEFINHNWRRPSTSPPKAAYRKADNIAYW
jgi:hypothetical protein